MIMIYKCDLFQHENYWLFCTQGSLGEIMEWFDWKQKPYIWGDNLLRLIWSHSLL